MSEDKRMRVEAMVTERDPLMWGEAEDPPKQSRWSPPPTFEGSFFDFITGFTGHHHWTAERFAAAYRLVTAEESVAPLPSIPVEHQLQARILMPLRNAKVAFVLGNYFGVIALCGLVAEMTAILLFEMAHHDMPRTEQAQLFGRAFAELGQERRVDVLRGKQLIDQQQLEWFSQIRGIRKRHLHFFDRPTPSERECLDVYRAAYALLATTVKTVGGSGLKYRDDLMDHLRRVGGIIGDMPVSEATHEQAEPEA